MSFLPHPFPIPTSMTTSSIVCFPFTFGSHATPLCCLYTLAELESYTRLYVQLKLLPKNVSNIPNISNMSNMKNLSNVKMYQNVSVEVKLLPAASVTSLVSV